METGSIPSTEISTMSFEEFQRFLSSTLGVAESALAPEATFLVDLAIDSLKMVELMLQMERQLDIKISSDDAWTILTVGDAYEFYVEHFGA